MLPDFLTGSTTQNECASRHSPRCSPEDGKQHASASSAGPSASGGDGFDGQWFGAYSKTLEGTIARNRMAWPDGHTSEMNIKSPSEFWLRVDDEVLTAKLQPDGNLHWSDGDIWTRRKRNSLQPSSREHCVQFDGSSNPESAECLQHYARNRMGQTFTVVLSTRDIADKTDAVSNFAAVNQIPFQASDVEYIGHTVFFAIHLLLTHKTLNTTLSSAQVWHCFVLQ